MIPCTSECVYQSEGLCRLDSAAAAGLPDLGGACVHFIPAARLGSPHRYSALAEVPDRAPDPATADFPSPDEPELRSV